MAEFSVRKVKELKGAPLSVWVALMDVGITENARTRRLLGRITPRDVRSMAAKVRENPYFDLSETGLMVTILRGWQNAVNVGVVMKAGIWTERKNQS